MSNPTLWNQLMIWPIMNVLVFFYKIFEWLRVPGALGFAIILLTVVIRVVLYPLMHAQLKSAKKMAKLKPHMDALTAKHKNDKPALQQAQLALYKEHGINPAAGCLPLLVQMPVLIALYNVFFQILNNGNLEKLVSDINQIVYLPAIRLTSIDLTFLGVNLAIKPSQWQTQGWWLLAVPLATGLLQWYQTKLMTQNNPLPAPAPKPEGKNKKNQPKEEPKPDMAADLQKQMMMITPIMFGFFAFQFPLGLALYWNVFGLFGIMQQINVNRQNA
jgi:YidC/Oxa1 family membrane protein insertase